MLDKVYLHIGAPKTGTSILQSYLAQNRQTLLSKGVLYPVTISAHRGVYKNKESHHLLTYSWAGTSQLVGWENFTLFKSEKFFSRVERFCKERSISKMILSAENTYWLPCLLNVKDFIDDSEYWEKKYDYVKQIYNDLKNYDTKIVIYLRRQDHWIQSWYNQHVKNGFPLPKVVMEFAEQSKALLDFKSHLDLYADFFGKENIIVRAYEKEQLGQGLFQNFSECVGIKETTNIKLYQKPRYNAQLPRDVLEFLNICNQLPIDQYKRNWLKLLIRKIANQFESNIVFQKQDLLSSENRIDLIREYEHINYKIATDYLNRKDGILFYEDMPRSEEEYNTLNNLSVERAVDIMMRVFLFGDVNAIEKRRKRERIKDIFYNIFRKLPLNSLYFDWRENYIFRQYF